MDTQSRIKAILIRLAVFAGIIFVILLFTFQLFFVVIDAGTVGVVDTFGNVSDEPLQAGFHLKNPLSRVIVLSTRTETYTMSAAYAEGELKGDDSIQALAKDGGNVWFDVSVLYKLNPEKAPEIYKGLGLMYVENIIRPEIRSVIRSIASEYLVNEIYSTKRAEVQDTMLSDLKSKLDARGIMVEDVLLRNVSISQTLSDSIDRKLAAQQDVQTEQFAIEKAEKEAQKRVAEAKGQRDAQSIINESITTKYLYYLYISQLQSRPGTIYVPTDPSNGLPLFRGID